MFADLVLDVRTVNGESPSWDDARQLLWFVDMRGPALHSFDPASRSHLSWDMPAWLGCFGIMTDGCLVLALRTGLARFDPATGALCALAPAPYDARRFCFNDGRPDRQGRLVVGAMYHPLGPGDAQLDGSRRGPLWRFDDHGKMVPLSIPDVTISNGLAFSPDGTRLYHSDTPAKTIWVCDYDPVSGAVANQRVFARVEAGGDAGGPDGAVVDTEGCYICAVFGAGVLLRFDPDGRLERTISLPARYPTMPALGGPDRRTLYVTTAHFPVEDQPRREHPYAGGLLALEAPAAGLPTDFMPVKESPP